MKKLVFTFYSIIVLVHSFGQISSSGLIAAYPFSGTPADSLGGTNAVIVGANLTLDHLNSPNGAYEFHGQDDKIASISDQIIDQTLDFTIHMWVKVDSLYTPLETNYILTSRHDNLGVEQGGCEFSYGDDGVCRFILRQTSGGSAIAITSHPFPNTDEWFSVTGVRTTDSIFLYLNGIQVDAEVISNPLSHTSGGFWSIGAMFNSGSSIVREMDGSVNDLLFYNQVLSDCEIYHLFELNPIQAEIHSISNYNGWEISCFGASDGQIAGGASNALQPLSYLWNPTSNLDTLTGLASGTYQVTVTDSVGCTGSTQLTLNEPSELTANFVTIDILCNGDSSGSVSTTILGGVPGYSEIWSANNPSALAAGQHYVSILDTNGCVFEDSIQITEPTPILITGSASDEILGNDGGIDATISGGVPSYSYDWNNDGTGDFDDTEDLANLSGGSYTLVIKDDNDCLDSATFIIESQLDLDAKQTEFSVYPNPASESITLVSDNLIGGEIRIISLDGKLVYHDSNINTKAIFDIRNLEEGIYTVVFSSESKQAIKQFIKL